MNDATKPRNIATSREMITRAAVIRKAAQGDRNKDRAQLGRELADEIDGFAIRVARLEQLARQRSRDERLATYRAGALANAPQLLDATGVGRAQLMGPEGRASYLDALGKMVNAIAHATLEAETPAAPIAPAAAPAAPPKAES